MFAKVIEISFLYNFKIPFGMLFGSFALSGFMVAKISFISSAMTVLGKANHCFLALEIRIEWFWL